VEVVRTVILGTEAQLGDGDFIFIFRPRIVLHRQQARRIREDFFDSASRPGGIRVGGDCGERRLGVRSRWGLAGGHGWSGLLGKRDIDAGTDGQIREEPN
jgi:hypothetical protein